MTTALITPSLQHDAKPRGVSTTEPAFVRWLLIGAALAFIVLFLVLPLVFVFVEAFGQGAVYYFHTLADPLAWSAIKLTLLAAGISVPLNCVFGVCAAWSIAICSSEKAYLTRSFAASAAFSAAAGCNPVSPIAANIWVFICAPVVQEK